jgi:hypothetical protein
MSSAALEFDLRRPFFRAASPSKTIGFLFYTRSGTLSTAPSDPLTDHGHGQEEQTFERDANSHE